VRSSKNRNTTLAKVNRCPVARIEINRRFFNQRFEQLYVELER
jgi:hypothetical protein